MVALGQGVPSPLQTHFAEGKERSTFTVELPKLVSLDGVLLDISDTNLRLQLPGEERASHIKLPQSVAEAASAPIAKFSKRRGHLVLSWSKAGVPAPAQEVPGHFGAPLHHAEPCLGCSASEPEPAAAPPVRTPESPARAPPEPEAYGSIWNINNWHWEEKNCMAQARSAVTSALEQCAALKMRHVLELVGSGVVLRNIDVSGEAGIALRKGRRILCYDLSVCFSWEGRDEFGHPLGVKGTAKAQGITQDDEDELPGVAVEVSTASGTGPEQRAVGRWMQGEGALLLGQCLQAKAVAQAILAAEGAQADPASDRARRAEELAKAEAARQHTGTEQARIASEQGQLESAGRVAAAAAANGEATVHGSVWNVNAWHWEERPMTDWSHAWLRRELAALAPMVLMDGLAQVDLSKVQVSGDASVAVRKGRPIVLFQLSIESPWTVRTYADGLGEARGVLRVPEFTSEEGPASSVEVKVAHDGSRGRIASAFRKECIQKVRDVLAHFVEALNGQLPRCGPTP